MEPRDPGASVITLWRRLDEFRSWAAALDRADVPPEVSRELHARLTALPAAPPAELQPPAGDRRYRELYELAPDPYLVTDAAGVVQEANRAAAGLLGAGTPALAGLRLAAVLTPRDPPGLAARLEAFQRDGARQAWPASLHPAGRAPRPVHVSAAALPRGEHAPEIAWLLREAGPAGRWPAGGEAGGLADEAPGGTPGEEAAVSRERVRVASELHDTLSQMLFSVALKLDWCLHRVPPASSLRAKLEQIRQESGLMMAHIRALIARLADPAGAGQTFSGRLRTLVDQLRELSGIRVELLELGEVDRLGPAEQEVLGKTFQEALANIAKHARASHARVRLEVGAARAEFEVVDDGVGLPPGTDAATLARGPGHFGLRQMLERIEGRGGRLELGRNVPSGVRLTGWLPVR